MLGLKEGCLDLQKLDLSNNSIDALPMRWSSCAPSCRRCAVETSRVSGGERGWGKDKTEKNDWQTGQSSRELRDLGSS